VVFADFGFCGLYRSGSAAERLIDELNKLPVLWQQQPTIKEVNDEFTEEEFLSFGWGERAAYWTCINAVECQYFGRVKNVGG
jgi:hypothetical protein